MLFLKKSFFLLFLIFLGQFFFFQNAKAFSIFPARYTFVVDSGKTAVASVQIYNDEDQPIQVTAEVDAFALDSDTGHTQFGQSDPAKSWIQASVSSLTLSPEQKQTVDFTIAVPPETPAGSHYLGLFLKQKSAAGQVGLGKRIGTLLFLHVGGEVSEKLQIQDFSFEKERGNRNFHIQLQNNGSIHLMPGGNVRLFNFWGAQISGIPVNQNQRKVLPNADWRETLTLKNLGISSIGKIRADLTVEYGLTGQIVQSTIYFWYFPWWSIVFALLFLFAIAASIFLKRSRNL